MKIVKWNAPLNDFGVFQRWQWAFRHAGKSLSGIGEALGVRFQHWQWAFRHADQSPGGMGTEIVFRHNISG